MFPIFIPTGGGGIDLKKHERYIVAGSLLLTLASIITIIVGAILDKEIVCLIGVGELLLAAVLLFGWMAIDLIRGDK